MQIIFHMHVIVAGPAGISSFTVRDIDNYKDWEKLEEDFKRTFEAEGFKVLEIKRLYDH